MTTKRILIGDPNKYSTSPFLRTNGNLNEQEARILSKIVPNVAGTGEITVLDTISNTDAAILPQLEERDIVDINLRYNIEKRNDSIIAQEHRELEEQIYEYEIEEIEMRLSRKEYIEKYTIEIKESGDEGKYTINDPQLGVVPGETLCHTCFKDNLNCPGHLGRIKLNVPIFSPFYKRDIIRVLTCFCNDCSSLLLGPSQLEEFKQYTNYKTKLHFIEHKVGKSKTFIHTHKGGKVELCERQAPRAACSINPKYNLQIKSDNHIIEYKKSRKDQNWTIRTVEEARSIFDNISEKDAELSGLGKNRPSDLIMDYLIVIPPGMRGAIPTETDITSDRMANTYKTIINLNNELSPSNLNKIKTDKEKYIYEKTSKIYKLIWELVESRDPKPMHGQPRVSIYKLIQGKEGIMRQYMMSKRVDFTARTVIGPDPTLAFGEIGVPEEWARYLTVPEKIFGANINAMTKLLRENKITHITKGSGKRKGVLTKVLDHNRDSIVLEIGDVVDRHLRNGDFLLLNRMPTLHKQGVMGAKVRLSKAKNITLHLSYTTPYNADFDGDEMNVHMVQLLTGIAEVQEIMNIKMCIPNDQNNAPSIGLVMDSLIGGYLLTFLDPIIPTDTWFDCLTYIKSRDGLSTLYKRLDKYLILEKTGKALISSILPEGFSYEKGSVKIVDGILVQGVTTKDHFNSII